MLGTGLIGTLVPLKLKAEGYDDLIIGIIGSLYYLGMFVGSINVIHFLNRIGASKTFITTGMVLALITFIPGMKLDLYLWAICRFISGYNLAWIYIIIESWILNISGSHNRGKNLAIYMVVLYLGQSLGQLFLRIMDLNSVTPFIVASSLILVSVVPVLWIKNSIPTIKVPRTLGFYKLYKISSSGIMGCVVSGIVLSSIYSLLPLYFRENGYDATVIATIMALVIAGGVVLQYPLGMISDRVDRRSVLIYMCIAGIFISLAMIFLSRFEIHDELVIYAAIFAFGGIIFSIYPVSLNHTCDHIEHRHIVEATQGMMLAYGIGSAIGPVCISVVMGEVGPNGIFYSFIFILAMLSVFMVVRRVKRPGRARVIDSNANSNC